VRYILCCIVRTAGTVIKGKVMNGLSSIEANVASGADPHEGVQSISDVLLANI
jgi:hypothetical protein